MEKTYREMNDEERLKVIRAAMAEGGFIKIKEIVDELEVVLEVKPEKKSSQTGRKNVEKMKDVINKNGLAGFAENLAETPLNKTDNLDTNTFPDEPRGSIYASEHRELAMEENHMGEVLEEVHKSRVLELGTPNPWADAEVVLPGHLKL